MKNQASGNGFDTAMRAHYRLAGESLPPGTRLRLRPRPRGARPVPAWARGWRVGAGMAGIAAALFAVTFALNLHQPLSPGVDSGPIVVGDVVLEPGPVGTLEQDPDFYAWLASEDADMLAME